NALISATLAGDIDAIPVGALKAEDTLTIKQAWDSSNAGTTSIQLNGLRALYFQYRDPNAPWVRDIRVRQALAHMQDRQTLVETLKSGLTQVAWTVPTPDDPLYKLTQQRGIPEFPYDLRRADQLLNDAGWSK